MQNTLVWEIISSLSKKERKSLSLFVRSPFFNQREKIVQLLELVLLSTKPPLRKDLHSKMYPQKMFDDSRMRALISNLHQLVSRFLLVNDFDSGLKSKKQLVEIFSRKGLNKNFKKESRQLELLLAKETYRHPDYYQIRYELKAMQNDFWAQNRTIKSIDYKQMATDFDIYFISKKLAHFIEVIAGQNIYKIDYSSPLFDEILAIAKRPEYIHTPSISFYVRLINMFQSGTKTDYLVLKSQLLELAQIFPKDEAQVLYFMVLNYCVRKTNENSVFYRAEAFELYRLGLDSELIFIGDFISQGTFNNIVVIGIKEQKLEWAEWFIEQYKNKLQKSDFVTSYAINKARIAYEVKDYRKALDYLQDADYENVVFSINARVLQLKIYFELEEYELLRSHLKTMKVYARRKKEYAYHSAFLMELIDYTTRIIRLAPNDKESLAKIKKEIFTKDFYGRDWLLLQLGF